VFECNRHIYIVHIIIVGRVLDMDIYDAMRRVTNQTWRRINGKRDLRLRHGTQDRTQLHSLDGEDGDKFIGDTDV
jgi:hypothetical protein